MGRDSRYFALSLESLRVLGSWAADCAERVLPVFESQVDSDLRPRSAIEGIREFAAGGKRTARLRTLAWEALAAASETSHPAAAAAARSACAAAASAYTHPLADVHQTKHILGPAAYAALAREIHQPDVPHAGDGEIHWAIEQIPAPARDILLQMPARPTGKSRLEQILFALDSGIRSRTFL